MNNEWKQVGGGGLWENEKRTSDAQPDFTGRLEVEGLEALRLAAWIREKDGRRYLSLAASRRAGEGAGEPPDAVQQSAWDRLASSPKTAPAVSEQGHGQAPPEPEAEHAQSETGEEGPDDLPF